MYSNALELPHAMYAYLHMSPKLYLMQLSHKLSKKDHQGDTCSTDHLIRMLPIQFYIFVRPFSRA